MDKPRKPTVAPADPVSPKAKAPAPQKATVAKKAAGIPNPAAPKPVAKKPAARVNAAQAVPKATAHEAVSPAKAKVLAKAGAAKATASPPAAKAVPPQVPAQKEAAMPSPPSSATSVDFDQLGAQLMTLQQEIRSLGIPVVIVFEGWDAAGKGTMLGELLQGLDPRGYKVHVADNPSREHCHYPSFRRYWTAMPAQGAISLFVGSWYRDVSNACLQDKNARKHLPERYDQILQMESQLLCNGTLLIKFFLNVSKKEQKARLKELESKKSTRWRVTKEAWEQNAHYDDMMHLYDAMMARTDLEGAMWHVLRSAEKQACKEQMYAIVLDAFTKAIASAKAQDRSWDVPVLPQAQPIATVPISTLDAIQTNQPVQGDYKQAIDQAQKRVHKLQSDLYRKGIPLIVGFEGWDAAGKGGCIRRLTSAMDARGFEVVPICAPTEEQKSHHYLWRFWNHIPKDGHVAIFDRTWYGRVMVERVEGFCTEAAWKRAYEEINQFELELARHGAIIRKFWLHIDNREQLARFEDRQNDPQKQWKITQEDWRNRDKWAQYEVAVNEMLQRTHTQHAPWIIVEANDKRFARLKILHTLIEAMEQRLA